MEEKKDYYILADSVEKFKEIENAYLNFKKEYSLLSLGETRFLVTQIPDFEKNISICPRSKSGKIKEIKTNVFDLEGRIIQSSPGKWLISLGNYEYLIDEINPDFKEIK